VDEKVSDAAVILGAPFGLPGPPIEEAPFSKPAAKPDLLRFGARTATALLQSI